MKAAAIIGRLSVVLAVALAAPGASIEAFAPEAHARAQALAAEVEREGDTLVLRWQGGGPVDIHLLSRPDARPTRANRVARGATGGVARVVAPAAPRPYLLIRTAGERLVVAERALPLEAGQNFRDLGGYPAAGGRTAWGLLYRSGDPSTLSAADLAYLSGLGIETVCDLRSTSERSAAPSRLAPGAQVIVRDYDLDMAGLGELFAAGRPTAEQARALFIRFYRDLPFAFAGDYRRMMRALVEGKAPLAFNCSAGKDRTGVAAALLLTALGVDRETVIADYLLSNRYYRPKPPAPGEADDPSRAMFARLPPDVVQVLMGVERSFIESSLDAIDSRPGGVEAYLRDDLGLSPADLETLRRRYLR